jgi:parvulin-like peptidyl-prolyl isomerase
VSRDKGRKGTSGRGGGGDAPRSPAAARRRGLVLFGVLFLVLFIVVAIAEGVGDPSIPDGDAAFVKGVPGDVGNVSEAEVEHAIELAAAQEGAKKTPKPGDPKYDELKETALKSVLEGVWIRGISDEWGIEVSDEEVAKELAKIKKESFKTEAEFQKFLKESNYTPEDVTLRVEIQMLASQLSEQLKEKAPEVSQSEIEDYYEAAKATQFTQKPSRDVRLIVNKDEKKAEEALDTVASDNSAKNWSQAAKKYSEDPATKASGGVQKGVEEGTLEEPLDAEVFAALEGRVEGPIKAQRGYTVFEVINSTPESVQELKAVESQIESSLTQRLEQDYFAAFTADFATEWTTRTFCADGWVIERCANYKSDARPASAPPACYEEDPKGGLPEACPAPVFQLVPAMPGSITPLEPQGKPLTQRPRQVGETGETPAGATGLPEGAIPPTGGEAPPQEAPPQEAPPQEAPPQEAPSE